MLIDAGLAPSHLWMLNVIDRRPEDNDIDGEDAQIELKEQAQSFRDEILWLKDKVKCFVAVGDTAMHAFGIAGPITKNRGTVWPLKITNDGFKLCAPAEQQDIIVVPIYHPSYLMRTGGVGRGKKMGDSDAEVSVSLRQLTLSDIMKAYELTKKPFVQKAELFALDASIAQIEDFVDDCIARKAKIALDIETEGLDRDDQVVLIGLADTSQSGICIAYYDWDPETGHVHPNWTYGEEKRIQAALERLFKVCPLLTQNGAFDVPKLRRTRNFSIPRYAIKEDTMVLHHTISPEEPHNLVYIASVYGTSRNWKQEFKDKKGDIYTMNRVDAMTYNMRDCVNLFELIDNMTPDLEEMGPDTVRLYHETAIPLIEVTASLNENGIPFDPVAQKAFREKLETRIKELDQYIHSNYNLDPLFNLGSTANLRWLLFGQITKDYFSSIETLAKDFDRSGKLTKEGKPTQAHLDRLADKAVMETKPFWNPGALLATCPKTEKPGKVYQMDGSSRVAPIFGMDEEARMSLLQKAQNRLEQLKGMKRNLEVYAEETRAIQTLLNFLHDFEEWQEIKKLHSTYSEFAHVGGRIYPSFNQTGTATGRYSCSKPNLQNWPKGKEYEEDEELPLANEVRRLISAGRGRILVSADYENLEVGTLAYTCMDPVLLSIFESGENMHDINTKALFGIDENDPHWKTFRKAAKIFQFSSQYGSTIQNSYRKMCVKVPSFQMTYAQFDNLVNTSFVKTYSVYYAWKEKQQRDVVKTREVSTLLGRKRKCFGESHSIERIALNTPSQGLAADIINQASIRVDDRLHKEVPTAKLILQIHDQLVVECDEKDQTICAAILKEEMERPVKLVDGTLRRFPASIEIGKNMLDLKEVA